ncbi:stage II sporulation protein M [Methanobrevibacter sp.]|uniref:stage II sporulation protein M n=1 Tax=Methanobrevibacter sp. TaxID=66852 RepID=UPI0025ED8793|nr:stage II sporulation protein M [Methanobrevibacter sp.]MBQ2665395.1 stage II sporulation protein M [Methanobrevibacter sp.]
MLNEVKSAFTENKVAILSAVAILFVSMVLGYLFEPYLYDFLNPVTEDLTHRVQTGVVTLTFQSIFLNNIQIVLTMFIYGILFCLSAAVLAFNGLFVGYYVATTDDLFQTLLLIIPHGIFEFSSCILACASGFVLFNFLYRFLKTINKQDDGSVREILSVSFAEGFDKLKQAIILLVIASILMAIAGFVEAYLTLPIAEFLYSILS